MNLKLTHYLNIGMNLKKCISSNGLAFLMMNLLVLKNFPAQILEHILKKKWTLNDSERDLIVMWHKFEYMVGNTIRQIQSHLVIEGEDQVNTAI